MADMMTFPNTWEEFEELYHITDTEQIYTNGARLIPSFRVEQWLEHMADRNCSEKPNNSQTCANCKFDHEEWFEEACDSCCDAHSNWQPKTEPQTDCNMYVIVNGEGERVYDCIGCMTDCAWKKGE